MKKFNLVAGPKNSFRPAFEYIQVKNGFAYSTDGHKLVKIPIKEAFGSLPVDAPTEFYFKAEAWKKGNFYKALYYNIKDNYLEAFDKKGKLGIIDILTLDQFRDYVDFRKQQERPKIEHKDGKVVITMSEEQFKRMQQMRMNQQRGFHPIVMRQQACSKCEHRHKHHSRRRK